MKQEELEDGFLCWKETFCGKQLRKRKNRKECTNQERENVVIKKSR
jgi:hypothetical protein